MDNIMGIEFLFFALLLGFCIGTLSGFLGIGGAFVLTPLLNIIGFPMVYSVGTSLVFAVGVSSYASYRHYLEKNINFKTVAYVSLIGLLFIFISQQIAVYLHGIGAADSVIRWGFVVILVLLAILCCKDRGEKSGISTMDKINLTPPVINLFGEKKISLWSLLFIGASVGFLKGFLGVGGGFILVPMFLLVLGMKSRLAIGTSLLVVLITSIFAAFLYFWEGKVMLVIAIILIFGAIAGINVGVKSVQKIYSTMIKKIYGIFLLLNTVGIVLKELNLDLYAIIYALSLTGIASVLIVYIFFAKKSVLLYKK